MDVSVIVVVRTSVFVSVCSVSIFVQFIQTLSLCGVVVSRGRAGTGTRSGDQGGVDRGGVPLGYFRY